MKSIIYWLSISLLYTFISSCNRNIDQSIELPFIPPEKLQQRTKISQFNLNISLDYDEQMDTVIFKINDQSVPFHQLSLNEAIRQHKDSILVGITGKKKQYEYMNYIDKELTQIIACDKAVPYAYLEHLFNWLKMVDRRKLFLRSNGMGSDEDWIGHYYRLPIHTTGKIFTAAILAGDFPMYHFYTGPMHPAPPNNNPHHYWSPVFFEQPSKALHIQLSKEKGIQIDHSTISSQLNLREQLLQQLQEKATKQAGRLFIWLDVDWDVSYNTFIQTTLSTITTLRTYNNHASQTLFQQPYKQLDSEQKRQLRNHHSIAFIHPNKIEYNYLKQLEEKGTLSSFLEHNSLD